MIHPGRGIWHKASVSDPGGGGGVQDNTTGVQGRTYHAADGPNGQCSAPPSCGRGHTPFGRDVPEGRDRDEGGWETEEVVEVGKDDGLAGDPPPQHMFRTDSGLRNTIALSLNQSTDN